MFCFFIVAEHWWLREPSLTNCAEAIKRFEESPFDASLRVDALSASKFYGAWPARVNKVLGAPPLPVPAAAAVVAAPPPVLPVAVLEEMCRGCQAGPAVPINMAGFGTVSGFCSPTCFAETQ